MIIQKKTKPAEKSLNLSKAVHLIQAKPDYKKIYTVNVGKGIMVSMKVIKREKLLPSKEDKVWSHLTSSQFLAGYSEGDSVYDKL